jgi:hypothetical protein
LGAYRLEKALPQSIQHRIQKWNTRENKGGMNLFSTAPIKRVKLTVPGTPFLECFRKGLVTLPLVPERNPVKRGETPVVDEAHVSWDMPWILQGLPTPPKVWN